MSIPTPTPAVMPRRIPPRPTTPTAPAAGMPVAADDPRDLAPGRRPVDRYQHAVRRSALTPAARLVALTLSTVAVRRNGAIRPAFQPGAAGLLTMTGLAPEALECALAELEASGWIIPDPAYFGWWQLDTRHQP